MATHNTLKLVRTGQLMLALAAAGASFNLHAQGGESSAVAAFASAAVPASAAPQASAAPATNPASAAKASKAADRALRRRILTALANAKGMRASGITVRTNDGDVLLEGWVPEQAQIDQASRVAQGVKTVRNTLTLSTF